MMEVDDEPTQMRYAQALADWADVGGYDAENDWDHVTDEVLSIPFDSAQHREMRTLSGGEQKRLVLNSLLRGPDEVLLLDEPDNFLDVPTKRWLEQQLRRAARPSCSSATTASCSPARRPRWPRSSPASGSSVWVHGGGFATYRRLAKTGVAGSRSCGGAGTRSTPSSRSWSTLKTRAAFNDGLATRYQAAQTRLRKFEEAGPPRSWRASRTSASG